jgi:ribosome maturation factor RimP
VSIEVSTVERVRQVVEPILAARSLELYDIELAGAAVRVVVETSDLEAIAQLTRAISRALDDADPIPERYTLEVSSPGLERTLRTPAHFRGAVGSVVSIKTNAGVEGERRIKDVLTDADDDGITVGARTLRYDEIERARTVFEWGPSAKPANTKAKTSK